MLFTDARVLAAIAAAWLLYYLPFLRGRQPALLVALSAGIYAYEAPAATALLAFSVALNALVSAQVARDSGERSRALRWAAAGVAVNLGVLAFFKYDRTLAQMIGAELGAGGGLVHALWTLPLPIGISFYTFHGISLLVDVYRGRWQPEREPRTHALHTALYLCFFPQLVAGPITKAAYFYPQIRPKQLRDIDWDLAVESLLTGYFLKLVVANNLASHTFKLAYPYFLGESRNELVALLFAYSVQIFSDFAGYSLIAIGLAALFGYRLPDNFRFPYVSRSLSEFWTRWHISLSTWLKDYLYIPLGGNRHGRMRTYANLMIVMVLGGLWHGAALSYAVWGAWHGAGLAIERMAANSGRAIAGTGAGWSAVRMVGVFLFVTLGWLLFKLPNFDDVIAYFSAFASGAWQPGLSNRTRSILLFSLPVVLYHAYGFAREHGRPAARLRQPAMGTMAFLLLLDAGPSTPFIYFQF